MTPSPAQAVAANSAPTAKQHRTPGISALPGVDRRAFGQEVRALRKRLLADIGVNDLRHLRKMERWGRLCTLLGYATAWIAPNPISAALMALGNSARWTMVTHHVMHRGYDRVPGVPARYSSQHYAQGWRRFIDWPDWMHPPAWALEHNQLHHYHTGELADPDLVEHNTRLIHSRRMPRAIKWLLLCLAMLTWKFGYYAPNTYWAWRHQQIGAGKTDATRRDIAEVMSSSTRVVFPGERLLLPLTAAAAGFWLRCVLPYVSYRFVLLLALFLPLGTAAWLAVLLNSLLAELLSNLHTFFIIVPNHAGDDVHRFDDHYADADEFILRQVIGSVNYCGGSDARDFLHGYLNYQIEHHVWPDLPMLKLRQAAPQLQAICARHGVPYIEQSVFRRFAKLWAIMTGDAHMRRTSAQP